MADKEKKYHAIAEMQYSGNYAVLWGKLYDEDELHLAQVALTALKHQNLDKEYVIVTIDQALINTLATNDQIW